MDKKISTKKKGVINIDELSSGHSVTTTITSIHATDAREIPARVTELIEAGLRSHPVWPMVTETRGQEAYETIRQEMTHTNG